MSTTSIQERISPPTMQDAPSLSAAPENAANAGVDTSKINFRDLITNSQDQVKKERDAKKNNDLSSAKTNEEFLDKLAESSKPERKIKTTLDKDDFMKLFVTQLQNQDPLNPDNGSEMAAKLAQFNSVEQMMNVNTSLQKLLDAQNNQKSMAMIQYVGKEALIDAGKISVKDGRVECPPYNTTQDSAKTTVQIINSQGNVIAEKDLGSLRKGTHSLDWMATNGGGEKVPDGQYSFKIMTKDTAGNLSPLDIKTAAIITGFDMKNPDSGINTSVGKIKWEDIKSIGSPSNSAPSPQLYQQLQPQNAAAGSLLTQIPPLYQQQAYQPQPSSAAGPQPTQMPIQQQNAAMAIEQLPAQMPPANQQAVYQQQSFQPQNASVVAEQLPAQVPPSFQQPAHLPQNVAVGPQPVHLETNGFVAPQPPPGYEPPAELPPNQIPGPARNGEGFDMPRAGGSKSWPNTSQPSSAGMRPMEDLTAAKKVPSPLPEAQVSPFAAQNAPLG